MESLDVDNKNLSLVEGIMEIVDAVIDGLTTNHLENILSRQGCKNVNSKILETKNVIKEECKRDIKNVFDDMPDEFKERFNEPSNIPLKRRKLSPIKKYPPINNETLSAAIDNAVNKELIRKIDEVKGKTEGVKERILNFMEMYKNL